MRKSKIKQNNDQTFHKLMSDIKTPDVGSSESTKQDTYQKTEKETLNYTYAYHFQAIEIKNPKRNQEKNKTLLWNKVKNYIQLLGKKQAKGE